mmetsp:Transcript_72463/g.169741  ORF Transcript_72463/g.169741 Transcript_72463/m.169741 type:complete len:446 (+) Transcript_72463:90-1427(+)
MVRLAVHGLDHEICQVDVESDATGRYLKEAIEAATDGRYLVCSQQLVIDTTLVTHDLQLDQVVTADSTATVTRLPEPANIKKVSDRKALGAALRPLDRFPIVAMELPWHGFLFDASTQQWDAMEAAARSAVAQGADDEEESVHPRKPLCTQHTPLTEDMLASPSWLPWWGLLGVRQADVAAVLALQLSCDMIGDGISRLAAVLLLSEGDLLAATARVHEADSWLGFSSCVFSASRRVPSWEALERELPDFAAAMAQPASETWGPTPSSHGEAMPAIGPLRISVEPLDGWTIAEFLHEWKRRERKDYDPDTDHSFDPRRNRIGNWPAHRFVEALNYPPKLLEATRKAAHIKDIWRKAAEACGGRPDEQRFSSAAAELREALQDVPELQDRILAMEMAEDPYCLKYDFQKLAREVMDNFELEQVFGKGVTAVMYDDWLRAHEASSGS